MRLRRKRYLNCSLFPRRSKVRFAPFFFARKTSVRFLAPPFPQKVTWRLRCSLVNALTTLRLANNFLRVRLRRKRYLNCSLFPRRGKSFWLAAFLHEKAASHFGLPLLFPKGHACTGLLPCKRGHNASTVATNLLGALRLPDGISILFTFTKREHVI